MISRDYYLDSLGINHMQEEALYRVCERLWNYQSENHHLFFFITEFDSVITNPFFEESGVHLVSPIDHYDQNFIESEFVNLAKSFPLNENSSQDELESIVDDFILSLAKKEINRIYQEFPVKEQKQAINELLNKLDIKDYNLEPSDYDKKFIVIITLSNNTKVPFNVIAKDSSFAIKKAIDYCITEDYSVISINATEVLKNIGCMEIL